MAMLTKIILSVSFIFYGFASLAQTPAVTSNGDEVLLYDDGTWKFTKKADLSANKIIDTNKINFSKSKNASFLLKSKITSIGINLDPQKWSFKKSAINESAEYSLQLKGKDAYGMLIAERIEVPLETLKNLALENAQSIAPDMKIVFEEYRIVNGIKIYCMQMDGTAQGIKFSYYGYYFSSAKGSAQFVTYTAQNLLSEYKQEMEELLNGFVVVE
jgi:hypothetical protein